MRFYRDLKKKKKINSKVETHKKTSRPKLYLKSIFSAIILKFITKNNIYTEFKFLLLFIKFCAKKALILTY